MTFFKFCFRTIFYTCVFIFALAATIASYAFYLYAQMPNIKKLEHCMITEMNRVTLCTSSPNYATLDQIAPYVKDAILISEDVGFYNHNGFDFDELIESFKTNIQKKKYARGGSTITQQLAKNVFLTEDKSITRKIREAMITIELEKDFTKDFILEKYLNVVQFGKDIYGVKKASEYYFGKSPAHLTILEGAYLAFLLPNPEKYSANFIKKRLTPFTRERLNDILYKLKYYSKISEDEYNEAKDELASFFDTVSAMASH